MVFTTANSPTSSSPQENHDEISVFLRQILHRSSLPQPSSIMRSHTPDHNHHLPCFGGSTLLQPHQLPIPGPSAVFSGSDRLVVDQISHDDLNGVVFPPSSGFPFPSGSNLSSESLSSSVQLRSSDNNEFAEDNDCDSDEGNDVVAEEAEAKQQQSRNQSKRSRAAEVHNLSEKRRRSRINEKMKALQNLIPNSNKTDKASMLDEAIEYLKQLQLQVQMLSMRNGLSLHPMCLPGGQGIMHPSQLSQLGINFDNSSGSYDINMANTLNTIPEASNSMLNLPNEECTSFGRPSLPITSTRTNTVGLSFGLESSMPANFRPLQPRNSPQAVCREPRIPHETLAVNNIEPKSLVTTSTRPGHNPTEGRVQQKHGPGQNQLVSGNFSGLLGTTSGTQMTS